jgi:DNA replication and repair protein RecF
MAIVQLEVSGFRNFRSLSISPSPRFNWVVGANGAGKTSLLEAIHFLGTTKSFRTHLPRHYIQRDEGECVVFGRVDHAGDDDHWVERLSVGVRRGLSGAPECKLNGLPFGKMSELVRLFPVVCLLPDSVQILEGDPSVRREFLDWTMFHVEHAAGNAYVEVYRQYERTLDQRNRLLREMARAPAAGGRPRRTPPRESRELKALRAWDAPLIRWATELDERRKSFLAGQFSTFDVRLDFADEASPAGPAREGSASLRAGTAPPSAVAVEYVQGWTAGLGYAEALEAALEKDMERGSTSVGPHRADLKFMSEGLNVREHFSRGQKKHLVALLKLRQLELFVASHHRSNVLFLGDDVFSELDEPHAVHLFRKLRALGVQCFATTIETPENKGFFDPVHDRMFHVEHGELVPHSPPPPPNASELQE